MNPTNKMLNSEQLKAWNAIVEILSNKEVKFEIELSADDGYNELSTQLRHYTIQEISDLIERGNTSIPDLYVDDDFSMPNEEGVVISKGVMADGFYGYSILAGDLIDSYLENGDLNGSIKAYDDDGESHMLNLTQYEKITPSPKM